MLKSLLQDGPPWNHGSTVVGPPTSEHKEPNSANTTECGSSGSCKLNLRCPQVGARIEIPPKCLEMERERERDRETERQRDRETERERERDTAH